LGHTVVKHHNQCIIFKVGKKMSGKVGYYYKDKLAPKCNSPLSVGCVAILFHEGKILIEERSTTNNVGFVGGKLEDNETVEECIKREVFEETNLCNLKFKFWGVFSDPSRIIAWDNGNIYRSLTIVFKANVEDISQLQKSSESKDIKFMLFNEIPIERICRTHLPIYESLVKSEEYLIQ